MNIERRPVYQGKDLPPQQQNGMQQKPSNQSKSDDTVEVRRMTHAGKPSNPYKEEDCCG